jgi:hypothetical protein
VSISFEALATVLNPARGDPLLVVRAISSVVS